MAETLSFCCERLNEFFNNNIKCRVVLVRKLPLSTLLDCNPVRY